MFLKNAVVATSWRTQVNRTGKLKFRQFYPLPQIVQVIERRFFDPILLHFEKLKSTPYAFGFIWPHLKEVYKNMQAYKFVYSLDMSGYDISIPHVIIDLIFKELKKLLKMTPGETKLYEQITLYHKNALIMSSDAGGAIIFNKTRGLLSGSTVTNLFGSLINMFCLNYFCIDNNITINKRSYSVLGDDCIFGFNKYIEFSFISNYFLKTFGLSVSSEKSELFKKGEKIYYLGHYFDLNGRYLNRNRLNQQLCFSETFIPEEVMSKTERIVSKVCSLLFKSVDGFYEFEQIKEKLALALGISELPKYYKTFFNFMQNEKDVFRIDEAKDLWMKQ